MDEYPGPGFYGTGFLPLGRSCRKGNLDEKYEDRKHGHFDKCKIQDDWMNIPGLDFTGRAFSPWSDPAGRATSMKNRKTASMVISINARSRMIG